MLLDEIKARLAELTGHASVEMTTRGNTAIEAAISSLPNGSAVLIPEEGGWLAYKTIPRKAGLSTVEVSCDAARINLNDLRDKLLSVKPSAFLYQNPGGYFAEQPMEEIYALCQDHGCLAIVDISGAIGTRLCNGAFADIFVCSFGRWKLVNAGVGGFISWKSERVKGEGMGKKMPEMPEMDVLNKEALRRIGEKLSFLPERINFLMEKRNRIIKDVEHVTLTLVRADELGFVLIVRFTTADEKERIINYCKENGLEWTECPRYIRLHKPAISIEVKRL